MDILFASISGSYQDFEIALFKNDLCFAHHTEKQHKASSHFSLIFQKLFDSHKLSLTGLKFIALDQGPGAFTSLRVTITFANALAYAYNIPLIGIDGLDALAQETYATLPTPTSDQPQLLISLLNAYNNEVYYALHEITNSSLQLVGAKGYKKIDVLLAEIAKVFLNYQLIFTGNGTLLHQDTITQTFEHALFPKPFTAQSSAKQVGIMGWQHWQDQENISSELFPLYLKTQKFVVKK